MHCLIKRTVSPRRLIVGIFLRGVFLFGVFLYSVSFIRVSSDRPAISPASAMHLAPVLRGGILAQRVLHSSGFLPIGPFRALSVVLGCSSFSFQIAPRPFLSALPYSSFPHRNSLPHIHTRLPLANPNHFAPAGPSRFSSECCFRVAPPL